MSVCRFCLANKPRKDITELQITQNDTIKYYTDILIFCLGTQVEEDPKVSRKLCVKCFRKTIQFFEFKTTALKSEAYFKSGNIILQNACEKEESSEEKIKTEQGLNEDKYEDEVVVKDELKTEDGSEDELLSDIKKIKYESIGEKASENHARTDEEIKIHRTSTTTKVCEECGKHVKNLKSHALTHLPLEQRRQIKCELCDKIFTSEKSKWKHKNRNHFGKRQECPICHSKVFCLDKHKRQVHDKEKTHLCQYCSRCFFNKGHLQTHLRSHTKEKPFMCVTCGKCFMSRTIMKNHMLIHSGEKKHACSLCDMSFVNVGYLNAHMLSHTKEKRFPCQFCGARFHRSDHRKRHEFTAHLKKGMTRL